MATKSRARVKLTTEEATRINRVADAMVNKIVAGETLRLAVPIVRLMHEKIALMYKRIEKKYGEVT